MSCGLFLSIELEGSISLHLSLCSRVVTSERKRWRQGVVSLCVYYVCVYEGVCVCVCVCVCSKCGIARRGCTQMGRNRIGKTHD